MWTNASLVTAPNNSSDATSSSSSSTTTTYTSTHLRIFSVPNHHTGLKELGTVELPTERVMAIQFVPGLNGGVANSSSPLHGGGGGGGGGEDPLKCDTVWVGTDSQRIVVYSASDPERGTEVARSPPSGLPSGIASMAHHCDAVWVGLASGQLAVYRRDLCTLRWDLSGGRQVQLLQLGSEPVSCLFPMAAAGLYAACGKRVWVVDAYAGEQVVGKHYSKTKYLTCYKILSILSQNIFIHLPILIRKCSVYWWTFCR